ncbi:MAG TPA: bifunctional UDP-sugar hydrolase/5'-nucleotidase [Pyrinomonadaceae bacterium]
MKRGSNASRFFCVVLLALCLLPAGESRAQQEQQQGRARAWITILSTTDLHGNIYPVDYYTNKPEARGLARVATIVRQARRENPNLLLVDSGDTIQGTPLAYFHNKKNNQPPDPVMLSMNALGFDAMAVGNHEYNFGLNVLEKARREASFPWLSSNTYRRGSEETYHRPYIVKELGGVRVGVLGLTTPGVPSWENAENYAGLEFREPVAEARKWTRRLREEERVDLVVVAMHMGLERDLRTGEVNPGQVANENMALAIAEGVPGVDVVLMGHTHREVPALYSNGVLLTQANYWGRHVARADVYLEREGASGGGRWRVVAKQARTISAEGVADDAEILKLAEPYDRETQAWLGRAIGESAAELTAEDARFRDTAILDLIQRVQLEAGKADVSMVASFNPRARIPKGAVTVRDIAALYIYENTLVVIEVTGRQLKDALEHSARYFRAYEPGKSPSELVDEKIPAYNFDIAEGVTYDLDLTKPFGSRIQNLRFKGQPVQPAQKFRLATNNYRVNGGGGYTMYKGAPVLQRSSEEIRELIIDWVERHKQIPSEPTNNWRIKN